ncbi:MAG: oligosaccharide flippase family protein, partial [Eudoraea sp.]|nr:oligosaccharide flippase family protein [Eudoraea sp.]
MKQFVNNKLLALDEHTREIIKKASPTLLLRFLGVACSFASSIILGRLLGVEGLGSINIINQLITVLMVFTMLGMDNVLIRSVAIGISKDDKTVVGDSIYTATVINGGASIIFGIIGILFSSYLAEYVFQIPELSTPFI